MHLRALKASNFRLLQDFTIEFFPDVTVLIGPNNAGKSNIVDAIVMTAQMMTSGEDRALSQRQGFGRIVSQHRLDSTIALDFTLQDDSGTVRYLLQLTRSGYQEATQIGDYGLRGGRSENNVTYSWGRAQGSTSNYGLGSPLIPMRPGELVPITDFFSKTLAIDPFRQVTYQVGIGPKDMIASTGADLAMVLHYHHSNDRPRFLEFEQTVRQVLPEIAFIGTPILGGPTTTVHLQFSGDSEKYDLGQISSGLKGVLVLLTAIFFSPPGSLIIIEEPENHLHPASQKGLCAVIQETANRERKQFILTTHSEVILNQFGVDKALFVSRDGPRATVTPLPQASVYQVWERMGFERTLILQALGRAPQVIAILEGRSDFDALEPMWGNAGLKDKVLPITSRGGGWQEIIDSARTLRDALARFRLPSQVFVLLDGDGNTAAKRQRMLDQGFSNDQGHVWSEKEVESYLLIPPALANISGRPQAEVDGLISSNPGTPGKDRLARVLDGLGIKGTPNNVIVQNALTNCPGEIPRELFAVPEKISGMLGLT